MVFVVFDAGTPRPFQPPPSRPAVASVDAATPARAVTPEAGVSRAVVAAYATEGKTPAQRKPARTVAQIMTSPVHTLLPDTTVAEAQTFCRAHGFRHLPVHTVSRTLAGIVSDRDLLAVPPDQADKWVLHVMTKRVLTATPDTELREVAKVMVTERVSALPIVDKQQTVVGIVTTADLLRCIVNDAPLDLWI